MSEKILISFEVDNAGAIKKVEQFKGAVGGVPVATTKATKGLANLKTALALVGTAFAAIGVAKLIRNLGSATGAIVRTGAQFETMAIQMRSVTGSAAEAEKATDWIVDFTANTPYQIEQVTDAFVRLRAFGLDPMDGTLQVVADMTSFLGGSMEKMNSIVRALGKSFTRGKMSMEELNMMVDAGVPVMNILSEKLGVSTQKLFEMSEKGQLGRDAIDLLIDGMDELAGGSSAALMESYTGLWSNLGDQITLTLKDLSEGGVLEAAKAGLKEFVDLLSELRDSGFITEFGKSLTGMFTSTIPLIEDAAAGIKYFAIGLASTKQLITQWKLDSVITEIGTLNRQIDAWAEHAKKGAAENEKAKKKIVELYVQLGVAEAKQKALNAQWKSANRAIQLLARGEENLTDHTRDLLDTTEDLGDTQKDTNEALEETAEIFSTVGGGLGLIAALEEGANQFSLFGGESNTLADAIGNALAPAMLEGSKAIEKLGEDADKMKAPVERAAKTVQDAATVMEGTFSDLLMVGFGGQLEDFASLWDEIWGSLAKSMAGILGDAFEGAFGRGGNISDGFAGFFDAIERNRLASGIAGAGMMYSGSQSGGAGGILSGAMGGGMLGWGIGSLFAGSGGMLGLSGMLAGPIGAAIGLVVGGALAAFGGSQSKPRAAGSVGFTGGSLTTISQDMSAAGEDLWVQQRVEEYRGSVMAMNNVLRLFADGELFDLIGAAPTFTFGGGSNPIDELASVFRDQWLPDAMREMFESAINQGLGNLGVDDATVRRLWSEVGELTGSNQITALETFISSLVNLSQLYADMDWNAITDETRQDSLSAFLGGMGDALTAVQTQMLGLDSMTLLERADQATQIEQLIVSARQAEIAMLRQIDQLQDGINRSIDSQIEGIRVGGMSERGAANYYAREIQSIMQQMRAGITSPEMAQQLVADLQRYVGAYQGVLGDDIYSMTTGGVSLADHLVNTLEEARGLSNDAFEAMRDQIKESNDALVTELQRLIEALTNFYGVVDSPEWHGGPEPVEITGNFDINIRAGDGFWADVDARIERRLLDNEYHGPN